MCPSQHPTGGYFRCTSCHRAFKRPEHLKRHEKIHTSGKPHVCGICNKSFARSDVLLRHEFVHTADRATEPREPRMSRACVSCSRARERCSRGTPCDRCRLKSIKCTYAPASKLESRHAIGFEAAPSHGGDDSSERARTASPPSTDDTMTTRPGPSWVPSIAIDASRASGTGTDGIPTGRFDPDMVSAASSAAPQPTQALPHPHQQRQFSGYVSSPAMSSGGFGHATSGMAFSTVNAAVDVDLAMNWLPVSEDWTMNVASILDLSLTSDQSLVAETNTGGLIPSPPANAMDRSNGDSGLGQPTTQWSPAESSLSGLSSSSLANRTGHGKHRGRLYATSSSARTTAFERDKSPSQPAISGPQPQPPISTLADESNQRGPREMTPVPATPRSLASVPALEETPPGASWPSAFGKMMKEFEMFSVESRRAETPSVARAMFPTMHQIQSFTTLFYEKFLPSLPIFHATLTAPAEHWILKLAMAVIGCQYTKTEDCDSLVKLLHLFLSWALNREGHGRLEPPMAEMTYLQAQLLSQIGLLYYGPHDMRSHGMMTRGSLICRAESLGLFSPDPSSLHPGSERASRAASSAPSLKDRWQEWVEKETARRLGYAIWMLDVMASYHFNASPLMATQMPLAALPHEGLWNAPDDRQWNAVFGRTEQNAPLPLALRRIFVDKETQPDLGEFSRLLLLHGVFHEIRQVRAYTQRPLSTWVPVAQHDAARVPSDPQGADDDSTSRWLSETETFASWRNAALDCVDVLHWWANGIIALQSGVEHMTVLHLHFSRVVLLVPVKAITVIIESLTARNRKNAPQTATEELRAAESEVLRWAHRDESKARLAAIHCGCVFWHLRRFSAMAFYEPQSVYLATLSLWAYSYYVSRAVPEAERCQPAETSDSETESSSDPSFIWIDRPNDDEMVQFFVRSGRPGTIRAFISGVGDIHEPRSPAKILKEGLRVLEKVSFAWGRDVRYVNVLRTASQMMATAKE